MVLLTPALSGCLDPPPASQWSVTYLGENVSTRAIELEEEEVRSKFPGVAEAMETAREQGKNESVHAFEGSELGTFLTEEGMEQEEGVPENKTRENYVYDKYRYRVNWTGSTFQLFQAAI